MRRESLLTQRQVSQAVQAFEHVHGRMPPWRQLTAMLHTGVLTVMKFKRSYPAGMRLSQSMVEEARKLEGLTYEEVCAKKAAGAQERMNSNRKSNKEREEAAIERVVSRAQSETATLDYVHDYRQSFRGRRMRATKVG